MSELFGRALLSDSALQGYYRLANVNDASTNARNLTNNGSSTFTDGRYGSGVNVNGSNQYLSIANTMGTTWAGALTICGWVKLNAEIGSGTWVLFNMNHETAGGTTSVFRYEFNAGTRRLKYVRYNSGAVDDEPLYNVALGTTWHHTAITYTGSVMTMYLDGNSVVTQSSSNTAGTGSAYPQHFGIGSDQPGTTATNAVFDDVAIFTRALSGSEIWALYATPLRLGGNRPHPFSPGLAR